MRASRYRRQERTGYGQLEPIRLLPAADTAADPPLAVLLFFCTAFQVELPLLAGLSPARTAASFAAFYSITSVVEVESDYGPFAHALRTGAVGDAPKHEASKAERPVVRFTNCLYRGPFRRQFEQIAFIGYGKV